MQLDVIGSNSSLTFFFRSVLIGDKRTTHGKIHVLAVLDFQIPCILTLLFCISKVCTPTMKATDKNSDVRDDFR